jgi:hypothetical protein
MNKKINMSLVGFESLDQESMGMLIDTLIEIYSNQYGIDLGELEQPEKPTYECETVDDAKEYLKKFRLEN